MFIINDHFVKVFKDVYRTVKNNIIRHNVPERIMLFIWLWQGMGDKPRNDNPEHDTD